MVGHEFELGESQRRIYTGEGTMVVTMDGHKSIEMHSNWLNIGDKIGFVVCRNGIENVMTYHYSTERNRNCDYINLVGESSSEWTRDWSCVVTFLYQDQAATASWAEKVVFSVDGNTAICTIGDQTVTAKFNPE